MDQSPRKVVTVAEVAKLLGRPIRSIQREVKDGDIPAEKLPGPTGAYLIDRAVVDQLLLDREAIAS